MYIGVDLGGTNTAAALIRDGVICEKTSIPTDGSSAETVAAGILRVCEALTRGVVCIRGIGIGIPGLADETGTVIHAPNLPLAGFNITSGLHSRYCTPVFVENDANCAALGEMRSGSLKNAENAVLLTLGTGIGGAVIINRQLHKGCGGAAGEFGHMVIRQGGWLCGCGRRGCFEAYASARGLIHTAKTLMSEHKDSRMWELCGGDTDEMNGKIPFEARRANDETAKRAVDIYIGHLAAGIVNIVNILQPDVICIGGGVANAGEELLAPLREAVNAEKYTRLLRSPEIVKAALGNDAGLLGAACLGGEAL